MSDKNTTYKVNQKIVYPSQGVGTIQEIKEKKFKDQMILYYVIYLDVSDMTVMIPVEKSDELGIRAIVSKEEALNAIEMIGQEFEPITSDWKLRYQMNLELLKKGSINDIASIVRCLYHRSKVKELPILERKLYDSAKKLLEDEISYSLEKTSKEVEAMIHAKLEPLGLLHAKQQSSINKDFLDSDDDEDFLDADDNPEDDDEEDDDDMMDDDDE
ncbi:MAG: CarD family transcriptional regulator [Spirochaetaceae bacterium]|nr:CarD family transcriptional regulator [Spirochaetaceae bacterium]MBQ3024497.1 CarD family transcriptional regulator [Spirochaetaceae bacterium]MBQ7904965.1 CarD family transcriptional regulator [Spirochaetaceae bacterium]